MIKIGHIGEEVTLLIRQGADFVVFETLKDKTTGLPMDLTGCQLRGQMRRKALSPEVVATFTFEILDAQGGRIRWGLTSAETAAITTGETLQDKESQYKWDREFVDALGRVLPWSQGTALVFREGDAPVSEPTVIVSPAVIESYVLTPPVIQTEVLLPPVIESTLAVGQGPAGPMGPGGMDVLIYDPRGFKTDAFDLGNLTGAIDGGLFT